MAEYESVIGLEVHVQLSTHTKLFSASRVAFGEAPNTLTDPICLGLPGALPRLNRGAIDRVIALGLALGCDIQKRSVFSRKNYFYPDVPKNYQISQFDLPLCLGGRVEILLDDERASIELERIHVEEDAGKSIHGRERSQVDLNRAGVPLAEIVTPPVLRRPEQAGAYLTALRQIVRYLGISDGNMEEGALRCDANISLRRFGDPELGPKVEVKNLNSISGVVAALRHEQTRQAACLARGEAITQQTRGWDPDRGETQFQRSKEGANDYRYFPEPDLPPLDVDHDWIERVRAELPELPMARYERFQTEWKLPAYDALLLTESRELADYFEATVALCGNAKVVSNWIMGELLRILKDRGEEIADFPVEASRLAELISFVSEDKLSLSAAKGVFETMIQTGDDVASIVEREGLAQISDESAVIALVAEVLDAHPAQVAEFLGGKDGVAAFFVGQIMKASRGKANPKLANQLVRAALEERRST